MSLDGEPLDTPIPTAEHDGSEAVDRDVVLAQAVASLNTVTEEVEVENQAAKAMPCDEVTRMLSDIIINYFNLLTMSRRKKKCFKFVKAVKNVSAVL